ncbi:Codanin-1 C-terminus [Halocaridina rubra]|uniref:Codanin-1 C-terminus n=1 Tax=Halocaridina rubra TaxID=373956 RepID=A0AAN8XRL5_HALRR
MAEILQILLERRVTPQAVTAWLTGSEIKEEGLEEYSYLRGEFVPAFLNFLRDQSNSVLQMSQTNGLTPCKGANLMHAVKYVSPGKDPNRKGQSRKHQTSSRAKSLRFIETPIKGSHYFNKDSQNVESSQGSNHDQLLQECDFSPTGRDKFTSHIKSSTPKWTRDDTACSYHHGEKKHSVQRLSLGDFINTDPKWANKRKSPVFRDSKTVKSSASVTHQLPKTLDISDENAFPMVGSVPLQGKQPKRRINPTRITPQSSTKFSSFNHTPKVLFGIPHNQSSSATFMASEEGTKTLEEERELLRQEKLKRQENACRESAKFNSSGSLTNTMPKNVDQHDDFREISPDCITNRVYLDILAQMYSDIILFNMVPSIMVELYYVIQLLTVRVTEAEDNCDKKTKQESYLSNSHNCVYFASVVLMKIIKIIKLLDRTTLRLLSENSRIKMFHEDFQLQLLSHLKSPSPITIHYQHPKSPIIGGVSFQSDTDNRNNFTGDQAFHIFRKQRDIFYEIIRMWEENHLTPGWSYSQALGPRIRYMLLLRADPTNFVHFARLFQSQLLTMCHGEDNKDSVVRQNSEDLEFLNILKQQHPEKYKRLHERLVTPSKLGGPCPLPSFPGSQEFFRDFIVTASHGIFNEHLKDVLIAHILLLNEQEYIVSEQERDSLNNLVHAEARRVVLNLRLLAKFLGYLEFLPYYSSVHLPENVLATHIEIRSKVSPPINLNLAIRQSASSGQLVIGVTWIIEYMSMVDAVALHSRPYLTIAMTLIAIQKLIYIAELSHGDCPHGLAVSQTRSLSPSSCLLLKLLLGWLFDLPNFPNGLFFAEVLDADIDMLEYKENMNVITTHYSRTCLLCLRNILLPLHNMKDFEQNMSVKTPSKMQDLKCPEMLHTPMKNGKPELFLSPVKTETCVTVSMIDTPENTPLKTAADSKDISEKVIYLDISDFVDQHLITLCCPFICELKNLLSDFTLGVNFNKNTGTSSCRRITPFSATERDSLGFSYNQLQLQLEDNFFHNQPSSVRKVTEFVIERLSSTIIKNMRMTLIPKSREGAIEKLKETIRSHSHITAVPSESAKEIIKKQSVEISQDMCSTLKSKCLELARQSNVESLNSALCLLLSPDITSKEVEVCKKIISRSCEEKVSAWAQSHITSALFSKDLIADSDRILRQAVRSIESGALNVQTFEEPSQSSMDMSDVSVLAGDGGLVGSSFNASVNDSLDLPVNKISPTLAVAKRENSETLPVKVESHNPDVVGPSKVVMAIKSMVYRLIRSSENRPLGIKSLDIQFLLQNIVEALTKRKDITLAVYRALEALTVDLAVVIIACVPSLLTLKNRMAFISLWKAVSDGGVIPLPSGLSSFMSPRIVMLVARQHSTQQQSAWKMLSDFTILLLSTKLLSPSSFQEQCVSLLRHSWDEEILSGLSLCIKGIAEYFQKQTTQFEDPVVAEFLEWVGWIFGEMEEFPDIN